MKKYVISTTAFILLVFWPTMAQEVGTPVQPPAPERIQSAFETNYLHQLSRYGRDLDEQGFYVESLDGSVVLADHHSRGHFNPASVIKIATSFAALDRLGPEYHFETTFEAVGEIIKKTRTLDGDLVLSSSGDPQLTTLHLNRMIQQVVKAGVAKVTGSLIVTGPFTYAGFLTTDAAIKKLESLLR